MTLITFCHIVLMIFFDIFIDNHIYIPKNKKVYALIDIANGHMDKLYYYAELAKKCMVINWY